MLKPASIDDFMAWSWEQIQPHADDLIARSLTAATVDVWLADWSALASLIAETNSRLEIRTTTHTNDEAGQARFQKYAENVIPKWREAEQKLKQKLLASGLEPAGYEIPLRRMRTEAAIYRDENLPLMTELSRLGIERSKISGGWTMDWDGEELTFTQLAAKLQDADRAVRERAWHTMVNRVEQDRDRLDELWVKLLDTRQQIAQNAGFESYRDYRWQELARFDYTPDDCKTFHAAIEQVVVPLARKINAHRKACMGLESLRVWDNFWFLSPDAEGRAPLKPYTTLDEFTTTIQTIFNHVDPELGHYFQIMRDENLLDLESRKHKTGGAYMAEFLYSKRPFIFAHAVGSGDSVRTLLHEGGHAFHGFEVGKLPYYHQQSLEFIPMEFVEVGSMAMELLASPYLAKDQGGFYDPADAARSQVEHLEHLIAFWPYMSVVDSFQHWIYDNPEQARDPRQCDQEWSRLIRRFLPDLDWTGMERDSELYWMIQGHIWGSPFYYIEYGLAQLGAVQVWGNALKDQAQAVRDYRRALSLGATATLPQLYAAAGAKLAFDAATLKESVDLIARVREELSSQ